MLGIDRHAARSTFTAILVVLLLYVIYLIRFTLFIFILALLFAYLLSPLVNVLDRALPGKRTRTLALALSYVIFVGIAVFVAIEIGTRVVVEATKMSRDLPREITAWVNTPGPSATFNDIKAKAVERIQTGVGEWSTDLLSALPQAGMKFVAIASNLIYVVIIPVLAFFFLKDGRAMREHLLDLVEDGPRRALLDDVLADVHLLLAHYMRALVLLSLAAFTSYSIFFSITRMRYGVLLAAVACLLEFIPMVGPLTASILILLVSLVAQSHVLAVLIFLVAYRMLQDYVISPHLMQRGVEVHPLLVLFGVFAGAEISGIAGTFLSVPVLAVVRIIYIRIRKARLAARMVATSRSAV
jgi:predicted PurR-regulated permease PerM